MGRTAPGCGGGQRISIRLEIALRRRRPPALPERLMRPFLATLLVLFASAGAWAAVRNVRPPQVAPILTTPEAHDAHSFARPEIARVTHVALDLDADFEAHRMVGTATLDLVAVPGAGEIILDSNGLEIQAVADARGRPLHWTLGQGDAAHGRPLSVEIG